MSKLAGFLRKKMEENQTGQKEAEKRKEQEEIRRQIDQEIQKARKQFELELIKKYREHRVALQDFSKKLTERELVISASEVKLIQDERDIEAKLQGLSARESELEVKEAERENQTKNAIKKYSDKKKKEILDAERASKEGMQWKIEELSKYEQAVYAAEYRVIDWMKRVDRREREAFEEIRRDAEEYNQCNQSPVEDGFDFERKFAAALKRRGFENVFVTEKSGDFGADILGEKDGVKYVIQCKYYTSSVGVKAVQQVFASKIHYSAHVAVVATNSVFTKSAKVLAEETGVLLWNGLKVQEMIGN